MTKSPQKRGGTLPSVKPRLVTKSLSLKTMDVREIRDFIDDADIVDGPEELYAIVSALWPDQLHKIKPPRSLMH